MKFTVDSVTLVDALGWVAKSLPSRPSVPILAGVKIDVTDTTLTLSAYDYEQSAVATLDVKSVPEDTENGSVVVSGKLFADIARALPKADVRMCLDGTKLLVQAKTSKFSLAVMAPTDYPHLPDHPTPIGSVAANEFAEAVRTVVPASGRDDMLPVLTAINISIDPAAGELIMAATDRFRLAVRKVPFLGAPDAEPANVLVPARTLDLWAKSLTGDDDTRFTFGAGGGENATLFAVEAEGRAATVRLIDGQYPKYQALIPTSFQTESVIETPDLIAAVKRVALVADRSPVSLAFTSDGIHISAASDSEASEDVDAQHVGADVTIGFNVAYLLDGLNAIGNRTARISLVAGNKPAVLTAVEGEEVYTYLLMPMRGGN